MDCQIMYCNRHSVEKYLSVEKTHGAIKRKMYRRLGFLNERLYKVEIVKSNI